MRKNYAEEQKDTILQRYWSGESVASISASTGVAKSTLYKWIRESPLKKSKPVNMTDFRILKQRCETLEKIVEILQMSPCTVSAPLHDRFTDVCKTQKHPDRGATRYLPLCGNIPRLAAVSQANRALRRGCEPDSAPQAVQSPFR